MEDSSLCVRQYPGCKISYLTPYVPMGLMQTTQRSHPFTRKKTYLCTTQGKHSFLIRWFIFKQGLQYIYLWFLFFVSYKPGIQKKVEKLKACWNLTPTPLCSTYVSGLRDLVRKPLKSNHQIRNAMAIKTWRQLTHTAVLQQTCGSTGRTLQFSDSKGYFIFNHYAVFGLLCGCRDGRTALFAYAFSSCKVLLHPFKAQGAEPTFRNFPEITNRSHRAVLCIYFVFLYRERQQAREFKWSSEKPKRKPQVLFSSSELMFSEA